MNIYIYTHQRWNLKWCLHASSCLRLDVRLDVGLRGVPAPLGEGDDQCGIILESQGLRCSQCSQKWGFVDATSEHEMQENESMVVLKFVIYSMLAARTPYFAPPHPLVEVWRFEWFAFEPLEARMQRTWKRPAARRHKQRVQALFRPGNSKLSSSHGYRTLKACTLLKGIKLHGLSAQRSGKRGSEGWVHSCARMVQIT